MSLLDAHYGYRRAGFSTIPVARAAGMAKKPLVAWQEYQDRRPNDREIRTWVMQWPTSNLGLIMAGSGHMAVDIDGDVHAAYAELVKYGVTFPPTAPVQATNKGLHVLFSVPAPVGDGVAWLKGPGWQVDIRGVGYIVAEPSVHESGVPYQWIRPFVSPAPKAPQRLLELLSRRAEPSVLEVPPPQENWVATLLLTGSPEGQRNNDAFRLAGWLRHKLPEDVLEAVMYMFADRCRPAMSYAEIDAIIASVARYRR